MVDRVQQALARARAHAAGANDAHNERVRAALERAKMTPADRIAEVERERMGPARAAVGQPARAPTPAPHAVETNLPIGDVPGQAFDNLWPSAKKYAGDIWSAVSEPDKVLDMLWGLGKEAVGAGTSARAQAMAGEEVTPRETPMMDAVGQFYGDRYGGWENVKKTMAEDPVGFLADASLVAAPLTLGASAAPAAGRALGAAGQVASKLDPLTAAIQAGGAAARGTGRTMAALLGQTTGTGPKAVSTAFSAGAAGGKLGQRFRQAMRGEVPLDSVVGEVKGALQNMYQKRGAAYRQDMATMKEDPAVLDFDKVDAAIAEGAGVKRFKDIDLSPQTAKVRDDIQNVVNQWKVDPATGQPRAPGEYHTVEGMDSLKQAVGNIKDAQQYGTPEWKVANQTYNAIHDTITDQAPGYARVMKDYTEATKLLDEITRELSLGKNALPATSLRKLQAIIRDDVSSAYGRRADLAGQLEGAGARRLTETLAGQAMQSYAPRGLRGGVTGSLAAGGGAGGIALADPAMLLGAGLLGAASSPRLVGEMAHAAGRVAGPTRRAVAPAFRAAPGGSQLAFQLGRARREAGL